MIQRNMVLTRSNGTQIIVQVSYEQQEIRDAESGYSRPSPASKDELELLISGIIRSETIDDTIAFGRGTGCRFCNRNISAKIMSVVPNIKPIIVRDNGLVGGYDYAYCTIECAKADNHDH